MVPEREPLQPLLQLPGDRVSQPWMPLTKEVVVPVAGSSVAWSRIFSMGESV